MKHEFVETEEEAIELAKLRAVEDFDHHEKVEHFASENYLIERTTLQCNCGESSAIKAVFFDPDNKQHYALIGICEHCGN